MSANGDYKITRHIDPAPNGMDALRFDYWYLDSLIATVIFPRNRVGSWLQPIVNIMTEGRSLGMEYRARLDARNYCKSLSLLDVTRLRVEKAEG